uniref:MHC class I alpha chain 1 n=3 Tax=Gallus gallus TaxID=9031 RepID=A0ZXL2_CHICK|nr:MHC class I alpha chain 1 [Gallus gallus]ACY01494.1 MHC class I alpha chain 1 [Gallus gallus]BAG69299.1 MHC class I alpha chain 1 [Gallus gallus]CAK49237.1 MHC class I antigen alpha chain precursor [Gallus gallus]CAK49241.1 MHC class I antigen alpha chain precursor [Gallus gallus]
MRPCGALGLGLLLAAVCGAAAELHTLRYISTAMTDPGPGQPWYVDVGYVDGELFTHYNSTARRAVPRTEWIAANTDQQYWDRETQIAQGNEQIDRENLDIRQQRHNQTGGSHTAQWMYGCDILEDGTIRGYHQMACDGRDFIALAEDMKTFTAAVPEAVPTKRKWEEGGYAERKKQYLEETCVEGLRRYVEYGKAELGRRERPEVRVWGKEADGILTLSCRAHGFYPRPIVVSWLKDGAVRGQDAQSGGIVPNGDGTYHTWVTIDAQPGDGDKYQCRVEHASLPQPGLYSWEPPQPNLVPIVAGVAVAIVAIAIVVGVGFILYRCHAGKKGKGYNIAPDREDGSSSSSTGSNPSI